MLGKKQVKNAVLFYEDYFLDYIVKGADPADGVKLLQIIIKSRDKQIEHLKTVVQDQKQFETGILLNNNDKIELMGDFESFKAHQHEYERQQQISGSIDPLQSEHHFQNLNQQTNEAAEIEELQGEVEDLKLQLNRTNIILNVKKEQIDNLKNQLKFYQETYGRREFSAYNQTQNKKESAPLQYVSEPQLLNMLSEKDNLIQEMQIELQVMKKELDNFGSVSSRTKPSQNQQPFQKSLMSLNDIQDEINYLKEEKKLLSQQNAALKQEKSKFWILCFYYYAGMLKEPEIEIKTRKYWEASPIKEVPSPEFRNNSAILKKKNEVSGF